MNTQNFERGASKLIPIIVVVAITIAGGAYMYTKSANSAPAPIPDQVVAPSATPPLRSPGASVIIDPAGAPQTSASYKDGTYTAEGSYKTPEEEQKIGVSITIKDGVVADSTVTAMGTDRPSKKFQGEFIAGYKEFVTGKKISEITVGKVSGSSLTASGFNAALADIAAQAKS